MFMDKKNEFIEFKIDKTYENKGQEFLGHVLLVDDEEYLVKLWKHVIERRGYKVTCFTDGLKALNEFKVNPMSFDIVITDQTMPLITGSALASEILKMRDDIKIIICSGYIEEMDKENLQNGKISEFLIKPFEINTLIDAIRRNLK